MPNWQRCGKLVFKEYVPKVIDTLVMAKEMFPGKRNNLDALCDRLEVDNSGRTLHGALLDAELLADVYINMTRGQDALLMDSTELAKTGRASRCRTSTCAVSNCRVLQANAARADRRMNKFWCRTSTKPAAAKRCVAVNRRYNPAPFLNSVQGG